MANYPNTYIPIGTMTSTRMNKFIDEYLSPKLLAFRQIQVNDEVLTLDYDRKTWRTLFGNILPDAPFKVIRAGERMMPDTYVVDNSLGTLTFSDVNDQFQIIKGSQTVNTVALDGMPLIEVIASYSFDYFSPYVLQYMVNNACNVVNTAGPEASPTNYSIDTCPPYWDGVITDLAFASCMEKLISDYDLWKGRLIFAIGADSLLEGQGSDIVNQLTSLRDNATERANKTLENPKFKAGGYVLSYPTGSYWASISTIGLTGAQSSHLSGRLRGWRPNRIGS